VTTDGELWIQVPPPGETYSSGNGSSMPTVVAELSHQHAERGGRTAIVVEDGLPHEPRGAELLRYSSGPISISRRQLAADVATAAIGSGRRHSSGQLSRVVAAIPPDFDGPVILHNALSAVEVLARLRPRARRFLYLHNDLFRTYGRRERARLIERCELVICVSSFVASRLTRGITAPPGKILVLINGADPAQFFPAADDRTGAPVILFTGRTVFDKGPHRLLRTSRKLVAEGIDLRLRVVGSSSMSATPKLNWYERRLHRSAAALGDRVEFIPFVDRLAIGEVYRSADIFCAPSTCQDACPLVLTEALASGLATVVSRRGGMAEQAGAAGRLFSPRSSGSLARALRPVLRDHQVRTEYQRLAAKRGEELTWSTRYEELRKHITAAVHHSRTV